MSCVINFVRMSRIFLPMLFALMKIMIHQPITDTCCSLM